MHKYLSLLLISFTLVSYSQDKKIKSHNFIRLYKVSDSVYRSEQPSKKGFTELEQKGVKTILNLRRLRDDTRKARHTDLVLEHIRLKSKEVNESNVIEALKVIQNAKKPILVHCWHGSDRTGVVTAAYRIVFENWTKEQAISEFRQPEFGYHEKWYPNLLELLEELDVQKIRKELGLSSRG